MKNKIYILTPGNVVTGGVELLHQLSYKLNLLGFSSCIVYCNKQGEPAVYNTPEIYEKYNSVVSETVEELELSSKDIHISEEKLDAVVEEDNSSEEMKEIKSFFANN